MVGTHGTVGTEGDLRDQDRHDGGGRSRSVALDRLTLAKNVRNLLLVRVSGGRYRDTGTEDVNSGEGRQGVVQGCRWVLTVGHAVQVLEVTEVTVKSCFLDSGSS